ncbi:hypothetical protein [Wenyingzhuangia aestuarii]|uniref:hypothetical protein n=1 Tax=Wenyingzhuangia aestuarii TaxID=1647582 RepID=UPI00143A01A0|nr:hypothetical protein [Wenyingzhuangia aestuarii]NJB83843.1 hypothetical protein [Wenyingzhuangia aestuarii]
MRFLYLICISVVVSCSSGNSTDILSFKTGSFKTYLGERKDSSSFYRTEKFQIESYRNQVDTFDIHWKSNFEYELRKVNPTSKLDSIPFVVKITAIKENYYKFKGAYLGSNFKQEGTTYKLSE